MRSVIIQPIAAILWICGASLTGCSDSTGEKTSSQSSWEKASGTKAVLVRDSEGVTFVVMNTRDMVTSDMRGLKGMTKAKVSASARIREGRLLDETVSLRIVLSRRDYPQQADTTTFVQAGSYFFSHDGQVVVSGGEVILTANIPLKWIDSIWFAEPEVRIWFAGGHGAALADFMKAVRTELEAAEGGRSD